MITLEEFIENLKKYKIWVGLKHLEKEQLELVKL